MAYEGENGCQQTNLGPADGEGVADYFKYFITKYSKKRPKKKAFAKIA